MCWHGNKAKVQWVVLFCPLYFAVGYSCVSVSLSFQYLPNEWTILFYGRLIIQSAQLCEWAGNLLITESHCHCLSSDSFYFSRKGQWVNTLYWQKDLFVKKQVIKETITLNVSVKCSFAFYGVSFHPYKMSDYPPPYPWINVSSSAVCTQMTFIDCW